MKKNYEITGMSCGGCVNAVKQALIKISDIVNAEVQLNATGAVNSKVVISSGQI